MVNRERVQLAVPPGEITLDILRRKLRLTGVKEGCREGDCGACTVMLGSLRNGTVDYQAVNSCLLPAAAIAGKHLVTIEGINQDGLNPIQEAFLTEGAVQCGFCTPGILMALTAHILSAPEPGPASAVNAVAGNICRCTGYIAIRRAIERLFNTLPHISAEHRVRDLVALGILPKYFLEIPGELGRIAAPARPQRPAAGTNPVYVAGGTDIFVQPPRDMDNREIIFLEPPGEADRIRIRDGCLELAGGLTVEELRQSPQVRKHWPGLPEMLAGVSSVQIRNRATIAGNIANASPIGDITIILLALGADVEVGEPGKPRRVPLKEFFLGYKQLAKRESELLSRVFVSLPAAGVRFNFEKVCRRQHLDIASVNTAMQLFVRNGRIDKVDLAAGGVAPIPMYLEQTALFLQGKPLKAGVLTAALTVLDKEISPISDMRGSAAYKRRLLRNLVLGHFITLFPALLNSKGFIANPGAGEKTSQRNFQGSAK